MSSHVLRWLFPARFAAKGAKSAEWWMEQYLAVAARASKYVLRVSELSADKASVLKAAEIVAKDVTELKAYARDLERKLQNQNATLRADFYRLAYATDAQIMADCKNFSESQKAAEIARLRKMMAREEARVYELARANNDLIASVRFKTTAVDVARPACLEDKGSYGGFLRGTLAEAGDAGSTSAPSCNRSEDP